MTTHPFKCALCGWRPQGIQETLTTCQQCGGAEGYEAACAVAACAAPAVELVETKHGRQWRCAGHKQTKELTR